MHPEFQLREDLIYLNHAAVAPWPARTAAAVTTFAEDNTRHGAWHYTEWLKVETRLREQLRTLLNAESADDIALVKNTSEALSLVAYGLEWQPGDNIVSTQEEFPSNRIPWESLAERGIEFRAADIQRTDDAEQAIFERTDHRTRLITVSSVQYGSGRRLDLERIGRFCREHGLLFCVDAIQSLGALRFDAQACHADFVMADGHKWMLGPEGLAVFYTTPESRDRLRLTQYGWHMVEHPGDYDAKTWTAARSARRFECGSPNLLGIHALSASLSLLLEIGMDTVEQGVLERTSMLMKLVAEDPALELLSPNREPQRSGIVLFRHRKIDNATLFQHLRQNRVVCALRGGGIRFSPHFYTPYSQLERAVQLVLACNG